MSHRIAVIAGDGAGPEVVAEARKAVDALGLALEWNELPWGTRPLPRDRRDDAARRARRRPRARRRAARRGRRPVRSRSRHALGLLLPLRQGLDLWANLRPARLLEGVPSPLAGGPAVDMLFVRENTEGEYSGVGGRAHQGLAHEVGIETAVFTRSGVERVIRHAFELAETRRGVVTSATKSNASRYGYVLWDEVAEEVAAEHPDVRYERVLVDALAARMVRNPLSLDVVVASNLFGDVLTDIAAELQGGMGMAASASLAPGSDTPGVFEPVHGSAPDIAGRGIANPLGAIWSASLMLDHLGEREGAKRLLDAVESVCRDGILDARPRRRGEHQRGGRRGGSACLSGGGSAVFYEIYVRSFADSDGDGVGDLPGIRSRLRTCSELGVDALWLTPFYPSPGVDHGYDVADYVDVDPQFGTLADFDALLADAHELGLRVTVDIVPNHTSIEHAWFRDETRVLRLGATQPNNWPSTFGGSAWTLDERRGRWYLHLFAPEQPDLDWHNEAVPRGVRAHPPLLARPRRRRLPDRRRACALQGPRRSRRGRAVSGHAVLVRLAAGRRPAGGASALPRLAPAARLVPGRADARRRGRLLRSCARCELRARRTSCTSPSTSRCSSRSGTRSACAPSSTRRAARSPRSARRPTWVLENHDVTRLPTRYGGGEDGLRRARAARLLLLALPGVAFLYQGQELGLEEVDLPDEVRQDPVFFRTSGARKGRDGCRVPIPWESGPPGFGFTTGEPWLPMPGDWGGRSVAAQRDDPASTLSLYRSALARRPRGDGFAWRDSPPGSLVFERGDILCLVNVTASELELPAGELVLGSEPRLTGPLPPNTAAWLRTTGAT